MNIAHRLANIVSKPSPTPVSRWRNELPEAFAALDADGSVIAIGYQGEWYKPFKPSRRVRLHNWLIRVGDHNNRDADRRESCEQQDSVAELKLQQIRSLVAGVGRTGHPNNGMDLLADSIQRILNDPRRSPRASRRR